jgi:hypothetical protein
MDKPEKLATQGTQGVEIQSKNTTEYVLNTTIRQQTQTTQIRHGPSHKQDMVPPTNNCNQRRTEHRVHEEIETDITTRISERKDT